MKAAYEALEDAELLNLVKTKDQSAFDEFYRRFEKKVYHFIRQKLNDPFEAYDILHEVFMEVWRQAERFEGRSKVSTWVFGIAFNKSVDRLRKRKHDQLDEEKHETIADEEGLSPMELVNATEEATFLQKCVEALSEAQRVVVQLAFFEDMSYPEIAAIIERPEGTVKTRIFHAKQALKRCVE
ncbi:MAG: sigma-70 family RNA polymerase sigma factor, partial [Sneathiella sp.]